MGWNVGGQGNAFSASVLFTSWQCIGVPLKACSSWPRWLLKRLCERGVKHGLECGREGNAFSASVLFTSWQCIGVPLKACSSWPRWLLKRFCEVRISGA